MCLLKSVSLEVWGVRGRDSPGGARGLAELPPLLRATEAEGELGQWGPSGRCRFGLRQKGLASQGLLRGEVGSRAAPVKPRVLFTRGCQVVTELASPSSPGDLGSSRHARSLTPNLSLSPSLTSY